jgi:hypothetical protein
MKVWFAGKTAQESTRFGVVLQPGQNEVDDAKGEAMIACGLVGATKAEAKEAAAEAAEPAKETGKEFMRGKHK